MISILKIIGFFLFQPTLKTLKWQSILWKLIFIFMFLTLASFLIDVRVAEYISINFDQGGQWISFWKSISKIGNGKYVISLSLVVIFIGIISRIVLKIGIPGTILIPLYTMGHFVLSGIAVQIFKFLFARPRPYYFLDTKTAEWEFFYHNSNYQSFPSGHGNTAMATLLVLLFTVRNNYLKAFFIIMAFMISLSRIILLKHYPSDIFAAWMLASLTMIWYMKFIKVRHCDFPSSKSI